MPSRPAALVLLLPALALFWLQSVVALGLGAQCPLSHGPQDTLTASQHDQPSCCGGCCHSSGAGLTFGLPHHQSPSSDCGFFCHFKGAGELPATLAPSFQLSEPHFVEIARVDHHFSTDTSSEKVLPDRLIHDPPSISRALQLLGLQLL